MEHKDNTTKKSTLEVDENDILKMSEKIRQNVKEDQEFVEKFNKYLKSELKPSEIIKIGTTPISMLIAGAENLDLVITQRTLKNSMNPKTVKIHGHTSGHDIPETTIKSLPEYLRNPVMILQGSKPNSLVLVTDISDMEEKNIIIPVSLNKSQGFYIVNSVDSIYGKNNIRNYIDKALQNNTVIAINKAKAEKMLHSIGCQSSKENTFISFDNSIAYTTQNVKSSFQNKELSLHEKSDNKKIFTVSRNQLSKNARKVKEQPAKDEKYKDKELPDHGSL